MTAYPQLPFTPELRARVEGLQKLSIGQLVLERSLEVPGMKYPAPGLPAVPADLETLQGRLEDIARAEGYPERVPARGSRSYQVVDLEWGICLVHELDIAPHHAFASGTWNFIAAALVPDLVKWRWGKDGSSLERWVGPGHGGRNCFGRLWRRAWTLKDDSNATDPYWMCRGLLEDEFVQIFERTALAGCRPLARSVARAHLLHLEGRKRRRTEHMRDLARLVLRLGAFIEFDALDPSELERVVEEGALGLPVHRSGLAG